VPSLILFNVLFTVAALRNEELALSLNANRYANLTEINASFAILITEYLTAITVILCSVTKHYVKALWATQFLSFFAELYRTTR
jgi:hypothetical protein